MLRAEDEQQRQATARARANKQQDGSALVYKTFSPPQPTAAPPFSPTQVRVLGQAIAMERANMREHVRKEIAKLRADLERDSTDNKTIPWPPTRKSCDVA